MILDTLYGRPVLSKASEDEILLASQTIAEMKEVGTHGKY